MEQKTDSQSELLAKLASIVNDTEEVVETPTLDTFTQFIDDLEVEKEAEAEVVEEAPEAPEASAPQLSLMDPTVLKVAMETFHEKVAEYGQPQDGSASSNDMGASEAEVIREKRRSAAKGGKFVGKQVLRTVDAARDMVGKGYEPKGNIVTRPMRRMLRKHRAGSAGANLAEGAYNLTTAFRR